jgi:hypothetical protein
MKPVRTGTRETFFERCKTAQGTSQTLGSMITRKNALTIEKIFGEPVTSAWSTSSST